MKGQHFPETKVQERRIKDFEHGSNGYTNYGCRGPICREGHAHASRHHRAERIKRGIPGDVEHGASCYRNWGCKCEVCLEGHAAEVSAYR